MNLDINVDINLDISLDEVAFCSYETAKPPSHQDAASGHPADADFCWNRQCDRPVLLRSQPISLL